MGSRPEEVKRRAQVQFGAAAERYISDPIHVEGDELGRMVELARLTGAERVLDVATGGGHTALAFAPHLREAVALDLTPAMLEAAAKVVTEAARVLRPGGRLVMFDNMAPEDDELDAFLNRVSIEDSRVACLEGTFGAVAAAVEPGPVAQVSFTRRAKGLRRC